MITECAHIRESRVWISETDIRVAEALLDALGTAGEPDDEATRLHGGSLRAKLASLGFDSMVTDGGGLAITGWNASGEPVSQGETDTALDVLAQIAPAVAPGCKCVMSIDGCGRGDRDAWLLSFDGVKMNEVDAGGDLSLIEYDNELERGLAYEGYIEHALRGHGLAGLVLTPSQFADECAANPLVWMAAAIGEGIGEQTMTDFEAEFTERRMAAIEKRLGHPTESRIAR